MSRDNRLDRNSSTTSGGSYSATGHFERYGYSGVYAFNANAVTVQLGPLQFELNRRAADELAKHLSAAVEAMRRAG